MKYSFEHITSLINGYAPLRGRFNDKQPSQNRLCFLFYDIEELAQNTELLKKNFPNSIFSIVSSTWGHDKILSDKYDCKIVGFETALRAVDYQMVACANQTAVPHKIQYLCKILGFKGRKHFLIYAKFLPTDRLSPRPNFLRENRDKIVFIVNHLSDEISVHSYLSRLKGVLHGTSDFNLMANYEQYFHPLVRPEAGDVVVEGGVGSVPHTTLGYSKMIGKKGKVYAFEPVPYMYEEAAERTKEFSNIQMEELGLWDKEDIMKIYLAGDVSTLRKLDYTKNSESVDCKLIDIDTYCSSKKIKPSLIKMDIEGAEQNALLGGINTIKKNKPKLQICLYHSLKDFIDIPIFALEQNNSYKMYVGNHTPFMFECLLYAI